MRSIPVSQLTLDLEPSLVERWPTLREFLAHRVDIQAKPAKTIAAGMDLSPSVLSRKLHPSESDTNRFNVDDLEAYLRESGDAGAVLEYLGSKFCGGGDAARKARMLAQAEALVAQLTRTVASMGEEPSQ
jgi:hypothetical protein